MKTKEEIEQLALLKYPKFSSDPYNPEQDDEYYERLIWIEGYTQCQEDMGDKKYTEEDIRKAIKVGISAEAGDYPDGWSFKLGINLEDYFINSLNKQD